MTKRRRTLAEVKAEKQPVSRRVPIVLDGTLAERVTQARIRVVELESKRDRVQARIGVSMNPSSRVVEELDEAQETLDAAKADLDAALTEAQESTAEFYVRAISPSAFDVLLADHAPTKDQRREAVKKGDPVPSWNWDTFPDALISACTALIVETDDDGNIVATEDLSPEDVKELRDSDDWNAGEIGILFEACQSVNAEVRQIGRVGNA